MIDNCPAGTYSSAVGVQNEADCIRCQPGKIGTAAGQTNSDDACQDCPSNNFRAETTTNEWTLEITSQSITESVGVAVIQQGSTQGTLKTALTGATTSVVINTAATDGTFDASADVVIGGTTVIAATITTAAFSKTDPTACSTCPNGFASTPKSSSCTICPAGEAGALCQDCIAGKFRAGCNEVDAVCDPTKCDDCPKGYAQAEGHQGSW